jgi:hypothetical protein
MSHVFAKGPANHKIMDLVSLTTCDDKHEW